MQLRHISVPLLALALLVPALTAVATLSPPERPYNILMLLPISSKSHRNVFMPLATELTNRGHKVTILSNHSPHDENPNITYIEHGLPHYREDNLNMFEVRKDISKLFSILSVAIPLMARDIYEIESVKQLYNRRKEFDVILVDNLCNEFVYPFTYKHNFIMVATVGLEPCQSAVIGNILKPAYASNVLQDFQAPLTFTDRVSNLFMTIVLPIVWRVFTIVPLVQKEINKHFPSLPPLLDMERNQSLVLLNSHFSLSTPLPLVPGQIEVGGMHCRPGRPLPKDLNEFVSGKEAVIYFSLGSVVRGETMPEHYQQMLVSAFSKLPYKVLWKFEQERNDISKNVIIKKWMPQQDILAHPNVKLFISHCGLLSTQEAMYHGKAILALPVFADQPKSAMRLQRQGVAKMLVWEELTEQLLLETIHELITNTSYQETALRISSRLKDQLQSPVERAVFWTEYVIRHSGALHLRSPELELSWVQVLHLDILLMLHVILFLILWSLKKLFKYCFQSKSSKKTHKKKREIPLGGNTSGTYWLFRKMVHISKKEILEVQVVQKNGAYFQKGTQRSQVQQDNNNRPIAHKKVVLKRYEESISGMKHKF